MALKHLLNRFSAAIRTQRNDADRGILRFFGVNTAGVRVTHDSAMQVAAVWACIDVIASALASSDWNVYGGVRNVANKQDLPEDNLQYILNTRWNPEATAQSAKRAMMIAAVGYGNGVAEIERDLAGRIVGLWPILPDRVEVRRDERTNELIYRVNHSDQGTFVDLTPDEVFHIRGPGLTGFMGDDTLNRAVKSISQAVAMDAFTSAYFGNSAQLGTVLMYKNAKLDDEHYDRLKESMEKRHKGAGKAFTTAILDGGEWDVKQIGTDADKAQIIEAKHLSVEEVCRWFHVPPHKVAHLLRCMPASTLVFTLDGPQRIVDVQPGAQVWSFDGEKIVLSTVLNNWENGVDEILEFRTTNRTVRCNAQHRLMVRRQVHRDLLPGEIGGKNIDGKKVRVEWRTEYVPAGEIQEGDTLVSLDELPDHGLRVAPNGRELTIGFMEFAGLLAGDGNVLDVAVTIARHGKASYMDHYREVMVQEFTCGGHKIASGEDHPMAKLTSAQVAQIRSEAHRVESVSDIAREFGVNINTACAIDRGREYHTESPCAVLDEPRLKAMKKRLADRTTTRAIAAEHGVGSGSVENIVSGRSWTEEETFAEVRQVKLTEGLMSTKFASVSVAAELKDLGLSGTAYTKSVPGWVFGLSEDLRLGYLRGIVDSDGTVDKFGRIAVHMVNRYLIDQIRHLFMSCGIPVTNVRSETVTRIPPSGTKPHTCTMHGFTCSDPGANRRVGSYDTRYIERLANGKPFEKKDRNYPRFGGKGFDAEGLSLSRIVQIRTLPPEPVYDIEVADHHCFIADGVVSHNSSNNNIEHQGLEFTRDTLRPWAKEIEQESDFKLIPYRGPRKFIEIDMDWAEQGDYKSRLEAYQIGRSMGVFSANDILRKLGENTIGKDGDIRIVQGAMIRLEDVGMAYTKPAGADPAAEPPEPEDDTDETMQAWLESVYEQIVRRRDNQELRMELRKKPEGRELARVEAKIYGREIVGKMSKSLTTDQLASALEWTDRVVDGCEPGIAARAALKGK